MDMFKRVFVINLDQRKDRWSFMEKQLRQACIPEHLVERVSAVDGRQVSLSSLHRAGLFSELGWRRLQEPSHHLVWGMDLNRGAVGCALSHLLLWSRLQALSACSRLQESLEVPFLILEDDSLLPIDFMQRYRERLGQVPGDWELLYLSGLDTAGQCEGLRVAEGVCRVPPFHRTTNAYVVTPKGARELLRCCLPLTYQLDTMMTLHTETREREVPYVVAPTCYTLRPPIVVQTTSLGSDIQAVTEDRTVEEEQRRKEAGW